MLSVTRLRGTGACANAATTPEPSTKNTARASVRRTCRPNIPAPFRAARRRRTARLPLPFDATPRPQGVSTASHRRKPPQLGPFVAPGRPFGRDASCWYPHRALYVAIIASNQEVFSPMANHLTPTELAREAGLDRRDVIEKCVELGVPIFQGRIDKTLFLATLGATSASPPTQHATA